MRIHYVPTFLLLGSAVLILLVAGVLYLKGRGVRRAAAVFRDRAVRATATVVALEAKDLSLGAEPDTRWFPIVRYLPDGVSEPVEVQTLTDVPAPPPRVGEELEVAYDPQQPTRVDVATTLGDIEGAGRTYFLVSRLMAIVAVGVAAAWLLLVFVVWTS